MYELESAYRKCGLVGKQGAGYGGMHEGSRDRICGIDMCVQARRQTGFRSAERQRREGTDAPVTYRTCSSNLPEREFASQ